MRLIANRCFGAGAALALSLTASSVLADPPFLPWSSLLPGLTTTYEPSSANACQSGQLSCVDSVIAEMTTRFNVLEASQPSMASRIAPPHARGAALGVYNTLQSLGFFAGGAVGGWLSKHVGMQGLFATCAALMVLWLLVAWPMRAPGRTRSAEQVLADEVPT